MVVLFPSAVVETKSGPQTASDRTASHITAIASDAHISGTRSRTANRGRSGTALGRSCEVVDISHLLPAKSVPGRPQSRIRASPNHDWGKPEASEAGEARSKS